MRAALPVGAFAAGILLALALPAPAFEARQGWFVADMACGATIRIRDEGGAVPLEAGRSYPLLGANKPAPTHYQIRLGSPAGDRWVPVDCGRTEIACQGTGCGSEGGATPGHGKPREYVLAVSWQPAFCEGHATKPECGSQSSDRFDATHLTLHGLWPQPRSAEYCGVDSSVRSEDRPETWNRLPSVELSPATRAALDERMPGTASFLDRHEWIKHGTCYGTTQEEYFTEALQLLGQLNDSAVRAVLAGRIGGEITSAQLRDAFDASFGNGTGDRVTMACDRDGSRQLVVELRINLAGEITETTPLADLLASAPTAPTECTLGRIDGVGLGG